MTAAQLEYLDELIARDEAAASALGELNRLLGSIGEVRERAEYLRREFEFGPAEVERRAAEATSAAEALGSGRARLADAARDEEAARHASEPDRLKTCQQLVQEASDSVHIAEARASDAEATHRERKEQLAAAVAEEPLLERRALVLGRELAGAPRLPSTVGAVPRGLAHVCEWALEVRAALVVARSSVSGEREQAIRQAGELGALVTGAPVSPGSMSTLAALVRGAAAS